MVSKHFITKWKNRIESIEGISNELLKKLWIRTLKVCEHSWFNHELVCIHKFKKGYTKYNLGRGLYENDLWVLVRNGRLITVFRRDENVPKRVDVLDVDEVSYLKLVHR